MIVIRFARRRVNRFKNNIFTYHFSNKCPDAITLHNIEDLHKEDKDKKENKEKHKMEKKEKDKDKKDMNE